MDSELFPCISYIEGFPKCWLFGYDIPIFCSQKGSGHTSMEFRGRWISVPSRGAPTCGHLVALQDLSSSTEAKALQMEVECGRCSRLEAGGMARIGREYRFFKHISYIYICQ